MNPALHSFFLDAEPSSQPIHAHIVQLYRRMWVQAENQHELIAYSDEFEHLLGVLRHYRRNPDENIDADYFARLREFHDELTAIYARRAQVNDLDIEVGQRLDEIRHLLADAYMTPGQPIDDHGYESWREARDRTLAEIEALRSNPELVPHLDRALTNLDELINAIPPDILLGDLPYFTTPIDQNLHTFFRDPSAFPDERHPEISGRYSALCAQLEGDELELLAYADGFMDFFNHARATAQRAQQTDAGHPYTAHLTRLWATTYAIFHRSTRIRDLNDTISEALRRFQDMENAAARDDLPLTESSSLGHWLTEARGMVEAAERYSSFPLLATHTQRSLSSLPELQNTLSAHTVLAEQAVTAANETLRNVIEVASDPALRPALEPSLQRLRNALGEPSQTPTPTSETPHLVWAGIGPRGDKTPIPPSVLADMTELARRMAAAGWHLSSGGADGSDTAFAAGTPVEQRTIWLPWPGYNDLSGPDCHPIPRDRLQQSLELAKRFHPTWERCKQGARKLHARNGLILLGRNLDRPVHAVVAYTQGGQLQGGTAQGLRIAMEHNIPIFNLGSMTMEEAWKGLQELHRSLTATGQRNATTEHRPNTGSSRSAARSYDPASSCVFRFSRDEWGAFSNFFPSIRPIAAAGLKFSTSEHLYQAAKFRGSPDIQALVAGASSARNAADMGRNTANKPDADWNDRRINAMRWIIRMKREANPKLLDGLLQKSGDRPIVEHSSRDSFWGARPKGGKLVGQNILGRLWMELRQQIRDGDPRALASAWEDPVSPKATVRETAAETADLKLPASLGLVTNHRRLLEAAQEGWLRPPEGKAFLLAGDASVSEALPKDRNAIPVRLTFDPAKFPFPTLRKELADAAEADAAGPLTWRAPIPLFALARIEVGSEEHKARLPGMAGQVRNVSLPAVDIAVTGRAIEATADRPASTSQVAARELPERLNAIQGALAMAAASLPAGEGWTEILRHVLNRDPARSISDPPDANRDWFALPWVPRDSGMPARGMAADQRRLWDAAMSCLRWPAAQGESPAALARAIARTASAGTLNPAADRWLAQTQKIIDAEESIDPSAPFDERAGLAIQLALLRPEPDKFKNWIADVPEIPQSVAWAGAVLWGWRHGYRHLDNAFRGDTEQQETIANAALAAAVPAAYTPVWTAQQDNPTAAPDAWQHIKAGYAALYRAAGDRLHHLPQQEGFTEFAEFVAAAVQDGGCPSRYRDRLTALHHTVQTQDSRHNTVLAARGALDAASARLADLKEKMEAEPGHAIETMPGYTAWLRDRDTAVENWRDLAEDPAHKEHMQAVAPDMMAPRIAELQEDPLTGIERPNMDQPVPASGQSVYTPSLQPLSQVYSHALAFVDRDPNLLAYAPQFDELKDAVSTALDECRHAPDLLDKLTTLRTTLDDSHRHMTQAKALTEDIANASQTLCRMKSWSESTGRPIHEAPNFKTSRADADRALARYQEAQSDSALAPHLARADTLGVLAETALPLLQDSRFREPVASAASVAAARQRSEQTEEQFSMSA